MEIKTIRCQIECYEDFDALVNNALAEGWRLSRRYTVPGSQHNRMCLIAELVKYEKVKIRRVKHGNKNNKPLCR